jgi:hypothetical protein
MTLNEAVEHWVVTGGSVFVSTDGTGRYRVEDQGTWAPKGYRDIQADQTDFKVFMDALIARGSEPVA